MSYEEIRKQDAADCLNYLVNRYPKADFSSALVKEHLTIAHRVAFCLKLWSTENIGLPDYSRLFLIETASDAQANILASSQGLFRATAFLQRAICENIVRHFYFTDHPIEFSRTIIEGKERPTTDTLFSEARKHPMISPFLSNFDAVELLHSHYTELCKYVHASTVSNMELSEFLENFELNETQLVASTNHLLGIHHSSNFLLLVFHRNRTGRFTDETFRFLLQNITKEGRKAYYA